MASKEPALIIEQKQAQRRLKRQQADEAKAQGPKVDSEKGKIINREWLTVEAEAHEETVQRVKILTWNLLAQTLVRRDLFPYSDCLKTHQRSPLLFSELLRPPPASADILCLQEVDRLEHFLPFLSSAGYAHHYVSGPRKKHGCLIAWKEDLYEKVGERVVRYDDQEVEGRKGLSFRTKNVGNVVALRRTNSDEGLIVATTHLFWHPRYTYERARQAGLLRREVLRFRHESAHPTWPCVLAGDFNAPPSDPLYALLTTGRTTPHLHESLLTASRVVHATVDPTVHVTQAGADEDAEAAATVEVAKEDKEEETETQTGSDKVITNARPARPSDGLLTTPELEVLYNSSPSPKDQPELCKSAYDTALRRLKLSGTHDVRTYGDRVPTMDESTPGAFEIEWSSYTFYWKATLDYIFLLDPPETRSTILGVLEPLTAEQLEPGIPRRGVAGSDHLSLVAEVAWTRT